MKCPNCSFDNTTDSKFCKECGVQHIPSEKIPSRTETLETPTEELIRGATFAGRYEIIEELGKYERQHFLGPIKTKSAAEAKDKRTWPILSVSSKSIPDSDRGFLAT
jgi:hypothetical protein